MCLKGKSTLEVKNRKEKGSKIKLKTGRKRLTKLTKHWAELWKDWHCGNEKLVWENLLGV